MSEHMCPIHGVEFFKTPKMKGYAHPVKDANGNPVYKNGKQAWCNEDDLEAGEPKPLDYKNAKPEPERKEWAPNPERQASIEAQNARTNLVALLKEGLLKRDMLDEMEPLELSLVAQLCDRAGIRFGYGEYKDKGGHLVEAATELGAVEKPIKTLGDLRERLSALGITTEPEQKRACGLEATEPWSNLKGDYLGAYKIAQETISPTSTR
jgi:hypothetical protein